MNTWTGAAVSPSPDPRWSNGLNWLTGVAPTNGDDLIFPANAQQLVNQDDLGNVAFNSITFTGNGYALNLSDVPTSIILTTGNTVADNGAAGTGNAINIPLVLNGTPTVTVTGGETLTFGEAISGAGGLTKTGPGTLTYAMTALTSPANTYTGVTTVNDGTLQLNAVLVQPIQGAVAVPGPLVIGDGVGSDQVVLLQSNETAPTTDVTLNSSGTFDLGTFTTAVNNLTMTGGTVTGGAGSDLTYSGAITSNAASAPATINVASLSSSGIADFIVADGPAAQDMIVSSSVLASTLNKDGLGALTLSGNDGAVGGTNVNAGTLFVTGILGPVTVNSAATLGGTGTVGPVTANGGGTVSPGIGGPAILNTGTVSLAASSAYAVDLTGTAPGSFDQLNVNTSGTVNLGGATLSPAGGFSSVVGDTYTIINNQGSLPVAGTFAGLPEGATFLLNGKQFQISYVGGDGNDVVLAQVRVSTTTALASSANPSAFGQPVIFAATVTPPAGAGGAPTGIVTFFDKGASLGTGTVTNGQATFTTSGLALGSHSVTASYSGDANFTGSASPTLTQTVNQAATATAVTSSANPSVAGQPVTFTATVTLPGPGAGTPTGTVQFFDGTTSLGTASLSASGQATVTPPPLALGSHAITASYSGDTNFAASRSPALTQTVNQAATATALASSLNPSLPGQAVTFTAIVTATAPGAGTPTGGLQFFDNGTSLGTATLNASGQAALTTSALTGGSHSITASYSGDVNFTASTAPALTQTVTQPATTVALTSSANPSVAGQPVTFTATVTASPTAPATPTGTVMFADGGTSLGTVTLDASGRADVTVPGLSGGAHTITAQYSGDVNFAASPVASLTQTVNQVVTTTSLTASPSTVSVGSVVTFTATVTPASAGSGTPTGTVTFLEGTVARGTAPLNSAGQATFADAALGAGTHSVVAVYGGDTNFATSTSSPVSITVNKAASATTLSALPNPATLGEPVTITAHVNAAAGTAAGALAPLPSGTVMFVDGTVILGSAPVVSGIASLTTSSLAAGGHAIFAAYSGDANYTPSTSPGLFLVVNSTPSCDPTASFVEALYRDVLGRHSDASGFAFWTQALAMGATRSQVAAGFWTSLEHRALQVEQFYQDILGRASDPSGKQAWVGALVSGASEGDVVFGFVTSLEYSASHPTNQSYVEGLYLDFFHRSVPGSLTPAEVASWQGMLDSGSLSRAAVASVFLSSDESYQTAITEFYHEVLARDPTASDRAFWLNRIVGGLETPVSLAAGFYGSDEYLARILAQCASGAAL